MRVGAGAVRIVCDRESAQMLEPQISVELISVIENTEGKFGLDGV